ncbi:MAG: serine acetyltransferase [candidate division Zixibacteria bacterium]|nr:serine acetyltransferase [candidate division Zixibacteria bacterium]
MKSQDSSPVIDPASLESVVDRLCSTSDHLAHTKASNGGDHKLPSRDAVVEVVEGLRAVLFPGYFGTSELTAESLRFHVGATLDRVLRTLREQVERCLSFVNEQNPGSDPVPEEQTGEIIKAFLASLPEVRRLLATDVKAAYEGDPAATSPDEAIFCYPGIQAIANLRIAHELYRLNVPLLPRMITEHAHSITGIDIHPGAAIGEEFCIDHGTGVVIGETCVIGNRVRLYQGVTLGAKSFPLDADGNPIKGIPRHPIVEDDVIIYSGATILGRVTIGRGSSIGGNVWLTHSVPPGARITQAMVLHEQFHAGAGI